MVEVGHFNTEPSLKWTQDKLQASVQTNVRTALQLHGREEALLVMRSRMTALYEWVQSRLNIH